jgi:hypothetical protein
MALLIGKTTAKTYAISLTEEELDIILAGLDLVDEILEPNAEISSITDAFTLMQQLRKYKDK